MSVLAEKQAHLSGHKWYISRLAFSPGGLHLASSSWDKTVRIWDLSTLDSIFVFRHHRSPVTSLAWQPGTTAVGRLGLLASSSADKTVALWSGETGKLLQTLALHNGWVLDVSFSSDGSQLASASWDKSVCLSDPRTGQMVYKLMGHTTGVWTCAFQSDGSSSLLCSGADDGSLRIWDSRTGSSVLSLFGGHDDTVKCCSWSPDGRYIVSGSADSKIALWEPRSGALLSRIRGHEDAVNDVQFYPFISKKSIPLIFSAGDTTCRMWHPLRKRNRQLQMIKQHRLGLEVEALAISPDGTLLATGARDKEIILSSLEVSLTEIDALPVEDENDAAINHGTTLWRKYTRKVLERVISEQVAREQNDAPAVNPPKNSASLVGRAVHKNGGKPKADVIQKEDFSYHYIEVNGSVESGEVLREQKSPQPESRGSTQSHPQAVGHMEVKEHLQYAAVNSDFGHGRGGRFDGLSDSDLNGSNYHIKLVGNSYDKEHPPVYENGDIFLKRNGYQSHGDSSSVSSSSYYGDTEDAANHGQDAKL